jgi:hypothetical protein
MDAAFLAIAYRLPRFYLLILDIVFYPKHITPGTNR